ncbi:EAL domain, c-di-GMP-specific phosphodiesterase class I (or its enzymatically inactive variant) [Dethiosulfatibacter aminovorans DSM 17477]|uniref:EAL domain, c-di-GMP-specific phosphodiesterase class I (Or its enzymatically inactive variant) n=1 Tax=Dethiosulfatibacter aminovorans DSM 17477 TaxID=1121476 RepID=A0A1M6EME5_9FIRM|nr:GGDEF domain-containing phosphodiesterase [Dethiosulfatibacter aminovorans]SHI86697.1 EAL domain, c-di-GMP-specific phosphodiesterase class I (or its enzymatically inactive variant) [Dethiosulfatibacter aminovorans DSM 17477]
MVYNEHIIRNGISELKNSELLLSSLDRKINDSNTDEFYLLAIEIANFNEIKRYLGYSYGEKSMQYVIERAKEIFKGCELFSVYTSEVFIILDGISLEEAYKKAKKLIGYSKIPVFIKEIPLDVKINCGIVNYPSDGTTSDVLYQNIGRTLSQCTQNNGEISIYNENITKKVKSDYITKLKLYSAIKKNELRLVYLPKYCIRTQKIVGAEALLRWDNIDMNIAEVIDIIERSNLITQLTRWVTKKVIEQMEEWITAGLYTKVSINVSPKDLENDEYFDFLVECIENSTVEANMLEIEITERCVLENQKSIIELLGKMKEYGFDISIDDFGTGYNSFKNFFTLPYHNIKIDKSIIEDLYSVENLALVKETINISNKMGIEVIAEGVEKETEYNLLNGLGCNLIQGYYISKPISPVEYKYMLVKYIEDVC